MEETEAMAKAMKWTAALTVLGTAAFYLLYRYTRLPLWETLAITAGTMGYHFCMRLLVGAAVNCIMKNRADYRREWYRPLPFEQRLYQKLKIKHWKDKVPTYDPSLFSLKLHSLEEIVQAMCQAEVVHEVIALLSFLPMLFIPRFGAAMVFGLTSCIAAMIDLTFVVLQRYNRARLVRILEKQKRV